MMSEHGTFVVPVVLNNSIVLKFTIDSGATDVSVPADVFSTLMRSGTVSDDDLMDKQRYRLADGSEQVSQRFRVKSLKVGSVELHNVIALVAPAAGELLLGQSFLARLGSWSIDNDRHMLVLNESSNSEVVDVTARKTESPQFRPLKPDTASGKPDEQVFHNALSFLLTGEDVSVPPAMVAPLPPARMLDYVDEGGSLPPGQNRIIAVDRAECVVTLEGRENTYGREFAVVLSLNNVDRSRSEIHELDRKVEIILRGERVVYLPARLAYKDIWGNEEPARPASSRSTYRVEVYTDEPARLRRAWNYVYSHGCKGSKSPF